MHVINCSINCLIFYTIQTDTLSHRKTAVNTKRDGSGAGDNNAAWKLCRDSSSRLTLWRFCARHQNICTHAATYWWKHISNNKQLAYTHGIYSYMSLRHGHTESENTVWDMLHFRFEPRAMRRGGAHMVLYTIWLERWQTGGCAKCWKKKDKKVYDGENFSYRWWWWWRVLSVWALRDWRVIEFCVYYSICLQACGGDWLHDLCCFAWKLVWWGWMCAGGFGLLYLKTNRKIFARFNGIQNFRSRLK